MKVTLIRGRAIDPAVNKVAKTLSRNGYDVKLLVWDRDGNKKTENRDGYTIYRFGFKAPYDKLTVLFYLPIWWLYQIFFLVRDKCDVIHACDLDTLLPAIFTKIIKRRKLYYTIYDFYADTLPNQIPTIVKNLAAFIEKYGIRFADVLFLVDESRYKQVEGAQIGKLIYIYNSPPEIISPELEYSRNSNISLFYAGNLHKTRGLEYIVKAIEDLDNIKLTFAGEGLCKEWIKDKCRLKNNIKYIGFLSYDKVLEETMKSDILFAFYDPAIPNNKYASPNKLFEAMMCGKPIVVSDDSSMAEIVRKENCGVVVPYGDVESIKDAIVRLKSDANLRERLGKNGRRAYEERYSWLIMEERILNVYENLVNRNE
jgi:glycosyltransferase involved in cell wall biosynthesis